MSGFFLEWFDDVVKPWKLARWPHHPVLWMLNNCGTKHQSVRLKDRASVVSIEIALGPANWTSKWQPFGTGNGKMWKELMLTRCPWAKVDSKSGCFFFFKSAGWCSATPFFHPPRCVLCPPSHPPPPPNTTQAPRNLHHHAGRPHLPRVDLGSTSQR